MTRLFSEIYKIFIAWSCFFLNASNLFALNGSPTTQAIKQAADTRDPIQLPSPIIKYQPSERIEKLILISAFDGVQEKIIDPKLATSIYREISKVSENYLYETKNWADLLRLQNKTATLLHYFLSSPDSSAHDDLTVKIASCLETFSSIALDSKKKLTESSRIQYWNLLAKYIRSPEEYGIQELIKFRSKHHSEKSYRATIDLLIRYASSSSPTQLAQIIPARDRKAQDLPAIGRIAQRLLEVQLAKREAHSNKNMAWFENSFRATQQLASNQASGIRFLVAETMLAIWNEKKNASIHEIPLALYQGFEDSTPFQVVREQEALAALRRNDLRQATILYQNIAKSLKNKILSQKIYLRIWSLNSVAYEKSKNMQELNVAITSASHYIKHEKNSLQGQLLKIKLANFLSQNSQYKLAASLYLELSQDKPETYLPLAIRAQSQLASWPMQPSFDEVSHGSEDERRRLLNLYRTLSRKKAGESWSNIAQIGLLERNLGNPNKADELWFALIKRNLGSQMSLEASGTMLRDFNSQKRWLELISLSQILQEKKAAPLDQGKEINYLAWYANALFEAGLAELKSKRFAMSSKYLKKFSQTFPEDSRIPVALNALIAAYRFQGKIALALEVSKSLIENYPFYPLRQAAILNAGAWSATDKSTWEYSLYFYNLFLKDYPNDQKSTIVRSSLAEIYFQRKLYGSASKLYLEQAHAIQLSSKDRLVAALKYMYIEENFGDQTKAYGAAVQVLNLADQNHPGYAQALAFMGKFLANGKDLKSISELEPKLLQIAKGNRQIQNLIGQLRFRRAELSTKNIIYTENNLEIADPKAVVKKYFDIFASEKRHYMSVCQLGVTSYCAPSIMRLTELAKQGISAMQQVTIADTLDPQIIDSFNSYKRLHINKTAQELENYSKYALTLARAGTTTPTWREEIMQALSHQDTQEALE